MAHNIEPMDVDNIESDFDNKENNFHHSNVLPCTEKGYEELDVSELNMKLRYSITPASSPMSKSYTAHCLDNRNFDTSEDSLNALDNANLTRSFNSLMTRTDNMSKSIKAHPLQPHQAEQTLDSNRNNSILRPLDTTFTDQNNITVTVTQATDIDDRSFPSSSSSIVHTPEATTPTKEVPSSDGGSPIMRGLKSVLNMFRPSQSPIPAAESEGKIVKHDISSSADMSSSKGHGDIPHVGLASTPIAAHKNRDASSSKRNSPLKDSVVFNDDLEKELLWKDETTILFSQEKIPIHKLLFQNTKLMPSLQSKETENNGNQNPNESLNTTVTEYMDVSYNDSVLKNTTELVTDTHSDGEFVDCETTFSNQSDILEDDKSLLLATKLLDSKDVVLSTVPEISIVIEAAPNKVTQDLGPEAKAKEKSATGTKESSDITKSDASEISSTSVTFIKDLNQEVLQNAEQHFNLNDMVDLKSVASATFVREEVIPDNLSGESSNDPLPSLIFINNVTQAEVLHGTAPIDQVGATFVKDDKDSSASVETANELLIPSTFVKGDSQEVLDGTVTIDQTEATFVKDVHDTSVSTESNKLLIHSTFAKNVQEVLNVTVTIDQTEATFITDSQKASVSVEPANKPFITSQFLKCAGQEVLDETATSDQAEATLIKDHQETSVLAECTNKPLSSTFVKDIDPEVLEGTLTIDQVDTNKSIESNELRISSTFVKDVDQEIVDGSVKIDQVVVTFIRDDQETSVLAECTNKPLSSTLAKDIDPEVLNGTLTIDQVDANESVESNELRTSSTFLKDAGTEIVDGSVKINQVEVTFIKDSQETSVSVEASNKPLTSSNFVKDVSQEVLDGNVMIDQAESTFVEDVQNTSARLEFSNKLLMSSTFIRDNDQEVLNGTVTIDQGDTTFVKDSHNNYVSIESSNEQLTSPKFIENIAHNSLNDTVIIEQAEKSATSTSFVKDTQNTEVTWNIEATKENLDETVASAENSITSTNFIKNIETSLEDDNKDKTVSYLSPSDNSTLPLIFAKDIQNKDIEDTKQFLDETRTKDLAEISTTLVTGIEIIQNIEASDVTSNEKLCETVKNAQENNLQKLITPLNEIVNEVSTFNICNNEYLDSTIAVKSTTPATVISSISQYNELVNSTGISETCLGTTAILYKESEDATEQLQSEVKSVLSESFTHENFEDCRFQLIEAKNALSTILLQDSNGKNITSSNNTKDKTGPSNPEQSSHFSNATVPMEFVNDSLTYNNITEDIKFTDTPKELTEMPVHATISPSCRAECQILSQLNIEKEQTTTSELELSVVNADYIKRNETIAKPDNLDKNSLSGTASNLDPDILQSSIANSSVNYDCEKSNLNVTKLQQTNNNVIEEPSENALISESGNSPADIPLPDEDELEIEQFSIETSNKDNQSVSSVVLPDIINVIHSSNPQDAIGIDKVPMNATIQVKSTADIINDTLSDKDILNGQEHNAKSSLEPFVVTNQQTVDKEIHISTTQGNTEEKMSQLDLEKFNSLEQFNNVEEVSVNIKTLTSGSQDIEPMDDESIQEENIITGLTNLEREEFKMNETQSANEGEGFLTTETSEHSCANIISMKDGNKNVSIEQMDIDTTLEINETETIPQNIKNENIHEEIIVSENNSPYVLVSVNKKANNSVEDDFEKIENPFAPTTKLSMSPPLSPKIVSKGYNFNFDEIEDPFATKTKIRLSPPLDSPNQLLKPESKKAESTKRDIVDKSRRKSQPERKKPIITRRSANKTFDAGISSKVTTVNKPEPDDIKLQNVSNNLNAVNNLKSPESNYCEISEVKLEDNDVLSNIDKSESEINVDNTSKLDNMDIEKQLEITTSVENKLSDTSTTPSSSEQSAYYSAATSSGDSIVTRNVFNLPEINDTNFNPFATKTKICQTPPPDARTDVFIETKTNCLENATIVQESTTGRANVTLGIETTQIDNNKSDAEDKDSINANNTTCSSKAIDEKDITVREVHTDDEDTIEGPFLEAEDLDDEKIFGFDGGRVDIMQFTDLPAQENEDNELFIDAEAFEFLLNQNKNNAVADSGKESLFLKFDPLFAKRMSSDGVVAALSKIQKRQSTPKKTPNPPNCKTKNLRNCEKSIAGPSTSNISHETNTFEESTDDFNVTTSKPMMVVTPAVNPDVVSRKSTTPTSSNRRSITFTSPAIAVIDRLLSLSANNSLVGQDTPMTQVSREQNEADLALTQLRELLAEKEIHVYNLRSDSKELKDRLTTMETQMKSLEAESEERLKKVNDLNEKLSEKTKINRSMAAVVEEYERTIASLIAETEQDKKRHNEERTRLIQERDEQTAHLTSMEVSFSDLHSKYEKSKQVILSCKANEDAYKKSIKEFEENFSKMQKNYESLKQHATSKLNHANQELEKINRAHESEVLKLNAMIKRKDLHITSLEETLAQKTKANEELTAICDELINKVG